MPDHHQSRRGAEGVGDPHPAGRRRCPPSSPREEIPAAPRRPFPAAGGAPSRRAPTPPAGSAGNIEPATVTARNPAPRMPFVATPPEAVDQVSRQRGRSPRPRAVSHHHHSFDQPRRSGNPLHPRRRGARVADAASQPHRRRRSSRITMPASRVAGEEDPRGEEKRAGEETAAGPRRSCYRPRPARPRR